jgi:hypothetical protein
MSNQTLFQIMKLIEEERRKKIRRDLYWRMITSAY